MARSLSPPAFPKLGPHSPFHTYSGPTTPHMPSHTEEHFMTCVSGVVAEFEKIRKEVHNLHAENKFLRARILRALETSRENEEEPNFSFVGALEDMLRVVSTPHISTVHYHDEDPQDLPPPCKPSETAKLLAVPVGKHTGVQDTDELPQQAVEAPSEHENLTSGPSMKSSLSDGILHSSIASHSAFEGGADSMLENFRNIVLTSVKFDMIFIGLIVANAILLAFDVQYQGLDLCFNLQFKGCTLHARGVWPHFDSVLQGLDWAFGIIFCTEALLKVWAMGCTYFCGSGAHWNWLDLTCCIAFLFDALASKVMPIPNGSAIRLLRLLRLARLLRVLRKLEALDALYVMATAIKLMSKVLFWAVVLLSCMLMTCALFLTEVLQASYFEDVTPMNLSSEDLELHLKMYEYFGSFSRCLLSMFEITLGNWPPVARLLTENVSEWLMILCVMHKFTLGFAVVGVINGVILQETFKVAATDDVIMVRQKKKLAAVTRDKMRMLFNALEQGGDGEVGLEEFCLLAQDDTVKTWLQSMDIETDDLPTLFKLIDFDGDGQLTVDELCTRIPRIKGASRCLDTLALRHRLNEVADVLFSRVDQLAKAVGHGEDTGCRPGSVGREKFGHAGVDDGACIPQVHTLSGINIVSGGDRLKQFND